MKNRILVSTILLVMFLFPFSVFGAVNYERIPSGYTISNPVSFSVSFDELTEICPSSESYWSLYWKEWYGEEREVWSIFDEIISTTIKDHTFTGNLPLTEFSVVSISCCSTEFDPSCNSEGDLEGSDSGVIFEVVEAPPAGGKLFDMPAGVVASTTAHIGNLFSDLSLFIWLAIGLPLGFWVIKKTIDFFRSVLRK